MPIHKSPTEKYKYTTKENNWNDTESSYNQNPLVGILSVNDFLKDHERIESLENYGVPVGLVYKKPDIISYIQGGSLCQKKKQGIPRLMEEIEESKLFSSLITVYKNGTSDKKNITRKNKE
jgi:hypothetical protein